MTLEDVPDARRCQVDAQDGQLTMDPAIAPHRNLYRNLSGHANYELDCPCGDLRATGGFRVGPFATDQLAMPTKKGLGLHEEPMELRSGEHSAEAGKECPVLRPQVRTVHVATEDRHLVTEHDHFDSQIGLVGPLPTEDLNRPEHGEIEEGESHGPFSRSPPLRRKSLLNGSDEILAPTGHGPPNSKLIPTV